MEINGFEIKEYNVNGFNLMGKTTGVVQTTCVFCSESRKKSKDKCCSVFLDKAWFECHHCGKNGQLHTYKKTTEKEYVKPVFRNKTELSDTIVSFFEKRKISQKTLIDFKVTESIEWMPKAGKEVKTINFNYFKNGELINIKYRANNKDLKLHKGSELIFYNLDAIKDCDECFIVEGEPDCLAMAEAGYKNTVSVPNGANLKTNNLSYVDNCFEFFIGKKTIYLAVDNDEAGRKLRNDLADRFGKDICVFIEFKDCKDANECLIKYGIQGIIESKNDFKQFPIEGVYTISDLSDSIIDMYHNGLDKGVSLQIEGFDLSIVKSYLTIITGIPSHGKGELIDYIIIQLRRLSNWKGALFSPENEPTQLHFSKFCRKIIGKHWEGENRITLEELAMVEAYLDNYIFFIKPEKDFTLETILNSVKDTHLRYGLDWYVIDPWNKLDHKYTTTETKYISESLDAIIRFNKVYNLHCFLVAHPTKINKDRQTGMFEIPNLYSINGSSHFYNKADNGITVYRDFQKGTTLIYRQKVKFDHWGTIGVSEYYFDKKRLRYNPTQVFDTSNWINNSPITLAEEMREYIDKKNEEPFELF
ncbi:MAG TPA: toprim domain-containing protein [bacterium]|nr:toprim domain-containing protein [bacterium]